MIVRIKFKYGLKKDYTMSKIYKDIQKSLHLSWNDMYKKFPDVCKAVEEEEKRNRLVDIEKRKRLLFNKKSK